MRNADCTRQVTMDIESVFDEQRAAFAPAPYGGALATRLLKLMLRE